MKQERWGRRGPPWQLSSTDSWRPPLADSTFSRKAAGNCIRENTPKLRGGLMGKIATVGAEQQHLRALEYANRVRLARARMKRKVAAGDLAAADVIMSCPWQAHSMAISDLLMSQKRWGRTRCRRLLVSLGVPENKQIGTLTERQRLAVAAVLTAKGATVTSVREPAATPPVPPPAATTIGRERALSAA